MFSMWLLVATDCLPLATKENNKNDHKDCPNNADDLLYKSYESYEFVQMLSANNNSIFVNVIFWQMFCQKFAESK